MGRLPLGWSRIEPRDKGGITPTHLLDRHNTMAHRPLKVRPLVSTDQRQVSMLDKDRQQGESHQITANTARLCPLVR